jgi:hypothetical protein
VILTLVGLLAAPDTAMAHKIQVRDSATAKQIADDGGRLLADYGSYQLYQVDQVRTGLVQSSAVEVRDDCNLIRLNAASIDTSTATVQTARAVVASFRGKRMHLIQFVGPIKSEWRDALKQTGAQIVTYIPQNSYLVYGDAQALAKLQSLTGSTASVQWHGDYLDDYKIHPAARLVDAQGNSRQVSTNVFAVQLVEDTDANSATLALIDRLKLEPVRRQYHRLHYVNLFVRLRPQDLPTLAAQPDVVSIQPYGEPRKLDERQDQIVAGNLTGNVPTGPGYLAWLTSIGFTQAQFDESGFVVDMSDSGIDNGTTTPGHFSLYELGNTNNPSRVVYNRLEGTPNRRSTIQGCDGHGNLNTHIVCAYNDQPSGFPQTDSAGYYYDLGVCPFVRVGASVIFDPADFTNPDFADLMSEAYNSGARISNNSWGDSDTDGAYNSDSQAYDALVRDAQPAGSTYAVDGNQEMVIVFAVSNGGPSSSTVSPPGTAKNVIAVGGTENVRSMSIANRGNNSVGDDGCSTPDSEANDANDMASFSSRGPCADGRIKPDLVAPATHVTGGAPQSSPPPSPSGTGSALSCFLTVDLNDIGICGVEGSGTIGASNFFPVGQEFFTESTGTSHATPAIAGACALLRQYFINRLLSPPSPAMTKAYLMNSARYVTGSGANDTLWSNSQGMGELDLGMAFDGVPRILQDELAANLFTETGQTATFSGTITDPTKPFRVTLAWTDPPGSTTGAALNNDLDLTVTIGTTTYKGNVFSGSHSIVGGSADHLNNVESVFLPAGVSGDFTVTITADNINSDALGNGDTVDQDFALVIYNSCCGNGCSFTLDSTSAHYDSSGGSSNVQVTASATNCDWTAVGNASFITITSGASGTGDGTVGYTVASNTVTRARTGTMTIAGQQYTVTQSGGCLYTVSSTGVNLSAAGAKSKTVRVKVRGTDCPWTAVSNDPFITITAGTNGVGSGKVRFTVPGNMNTVPLTGTMTIAGQTFTVNQAAGGCTNKLSPATAKFKAAGGSKTVKVKTKYPDCAWTAVSNDPFITITAGANGVGKGVVYYTVATNTSSVATNGTMTIAGETCTITQSAGP